MKIRHFRVSGPLLAGLFLASWFAPAAAQQPTPDQIAAIRQSCRSDFMSNCAGVQPGTREALECLKRNADKVSAPCRSALDGVGAKPAAEGSAPPPAAPKPEPAQATTAPPPPAEPVPPSVEAAPAAAVHKKPNQRQTGAVRAACRSDFMAQCPGVKPGGTAALNCLRSLSAQLSPACGSAVAALGEGGAPAPTAAPVVPAVAPVAPVVAPVAPAVAPLGPIPPMRPREALAILSFCGAERQALCASVPPGGGRIIACLAENAPRLSPGCYGAIARATR